MKILMKYLPKVYVGEEAPDYIIEEADTKKYTYKKALECAENYNLDIDNELYVARVTKVDNDGFRQTKILSYHKPLKRNPFRLKSKNNFLGGDAFNCIYNIPISEGE